MNTVNGTARQPDDYEQLTSTETFGRSDFSRTLVDGQFRWVTSRAPHSKREARHRRRATPSVSPLGWLLWAPASRTSALGDSTATVTTTDDVASLADLRTLVNDNGSSTVEPGEQLTYDLHGQKQQARLHRQTRPSPAPWTWAHPSSPLRWQVRRPGSAGGPAERSRVHSGRWNSATPQVVISSSRSQTTPQRIFDLPP